MLTLERADSRADDGRCEQQVVPGFSSDFTRAGPVLTSPTIYIILDILDRIIFWAIGDCAGVRGAWLSAELYEERKRGWTRRQARGALLIRAEVRVVSE